MGRGRRTHRHPPCRPQSRATGQVGQCAPSGGLWTTGPHCPALLGSCPGQGHLPSLHHLHQAACHHRHHHWQDPPPTDPHTHTCTTHTPSMLTSSTGQGRLLWTLHPTTSGRRRLPRPTWSRWPNAASGASLTALQAVRTRPHRCFPLALVARPARTTPRQPPNHPHHWQVGRCHWTRCMAGTSSTPTCLLAMNRKVSGLAVQFCHICVVLNSHLQLSAYVRPSNGNTTAPSTHPACSHAAHGLWSQHQATCKQVHLHASCYGSQPFAMSVLLFCA